MRRSLGVLFTVHVSALAIWLGVIISSGYFAAILFPTMKALNPHLADFGAYPGEHWRIAAGRVATRVFIAGSVAGFGLWGASFLALASSCFGGRSVRCLWPVFAGLGVLLGVSVAGQFLVVGPMIGDINAYWQAARQGDLQVAATHQRAFDASHPTASALLGTQAVLILACLAAAAWKLAFISRRGPAGEGAGQTQAPR